LWGEIKWGGGVSYPRSLFGWKSISLDKLKLTADDVLEFAEENGGQDARIKIENNCTIGVSLNPSGDSKAWHIGYYTGGIGSAFEMDLAPYTGWYRIRNTK
jgi:hypothetical protein